ncbi:MAG TPA: hypothetical protein VGH28_02015 [Polyangiaceae bacterium]
MSLLFGGSMIGLRSIVSGLPVKMLLDPKKALADTQAQCLGNLGAAQFIILNTSGSGDPFSCNGPGTYDDPVNKGDMSPLAHPDPATFPYMAPTAIGLGSQTYKAAQIWSTLGPGTGNADVLDRTCFIHMMTNTPVHPKEPQVLELMGATQYNEMFPSVLAKQLAPCLGTLQTQPISVGATTPSEALQFGGQALPTVPPTALSATLTNAKTGPSAGMTNLQGLRDQTLNQMYQWYKDTSQTSPAQRAYIDSLVTSQSQARDPAIQDRLGMLSGITKNDNNGQITAAIALILMKVTPVIAVHFPFGGDNHSDPGFTNEATQSQTGLQAIVQLMTQLKANSLQDSVSFLNLNVFGRTMGPANTQGRQHNQCHQMSLMIGKPFKGGVVGGVTSVDAQGNPVAVGNSKFFDYGCTGIDSATGKPVIGGGDVAPVDTLASWGKTVLSAVGATSDEVNAAITGGKIIQGAIA